MLENMVTEDGYFVSQKAEEVDAGITLYVPPNEIYSSEHDLVELVENEMKKQ